jgi:hypothetical protein
VRRAAVRLLAFLAIGGATACTLLESKDGLVGPAAGGDGGSQGADAADGKTPFGLDATTEGGDGDVTIETIDGSGDGPHDGSAGSDSPTPADAGADGPVAIYTGLVAPLGIAVHAGTLCWVQGQALRSIACAPAGGGSASQVTTVATQSNDPLVQDAFDVALDDAYVYWSNGPMNQVVRQPRDGGASSQYFTGDQQVSYIVLEGTTVWLTDYVAGATSGNVSYGPFNGPQSQLVYPSEKQAAGVANYAGSVYWGTPATLSIGPEPGNATIVRVPTPGQVTGLAIDAAGTAYFLSGNHDVYRLPQGASSPLLVYATPGAAFGDSDLALDGAAIYWSEHDAGRIMRLAK